MIRVNILDSSPVYLYGLSRILEEAGIRVLGAQTAPSQEVNWLIDVSLVDPEALDPDSSKEYLTQLCAVNNVLLIAHAYDDDTVRDLAHTGVSGVVLKCEPSEVVIEAVRTVSTGATWHHAPVALPPEESEETTRHPVLSEREHQVLRQISCGRTHSQVARQLGISRHTVDTYVKRIRSKLGVGNKAELTRAAVLLPKYGYRTSYQ